MKANSKINRVCTTGQSVAICIGAALMVTMAAVACGTNSSSDGSAAAVGPWPISATGLGQTCPTGQVFVSGYTNNGTNCLTECADHPGYGLVPGQNICVPGTTAANPVAASVFFGAGAPINRAQFAQMLKFMGKCDPYWVGINLGDASCDTYSGSLQAQITSNGSGAVQVVIVAGSGGGISLASSGNLQPYNNSQGYVANTSNGIRIVIDSSTMNNPTIPVHFQYQGADFAMLNLRRTQ